MADITPEYLKKVACAAIDDKLAGLDDLSRRIWGNPELMFEEHFAHQTLSDFLEEAKFPVERGYELPTAFRSVSGTQPGPHVAVLCEYDALPGIGHACGHNLIAEVGVTAALGIKAALDAASKAGKSLGTLTVLGTPAEEGGGGKIDLIRAGAFDSVDVAVMAHPSVYNESRPRTILAKNGVTVTYRGRASHAAAFPWEGVNALDAAVLAYSSISALRQQLKPSWRVHGIIKDGGAKANIIPETASLEYYMRTPTNQDMAVLVEKVRSCFLGAATATGCEVDLEFEDKPYESFLPNNKLSALYETNAESLGFEADSKTTETLCGSTDMGNVSQRVPSLHAQFYIGSKAALHTRDFTKAAGDPKAQPYTIDVGKAMAMAAIDVYCQPHLVAEMKAELRESQASRD